jgi:hypothetical protein
LIITPNHLHRFVGLYGSTFLTPENYLILIAFIQRK